MEFIAFDLETTGVRSQEDFIVEIGAVRFSENQARESFGVLIDPGVPMPPPASAVNGITDDMLRGQPSIDEVLGDFSRFCGELPLVAHNAPFDFKFLLEAIKRHRLQAPQGVVLDTLPLARQIFKGLPNYKLGTLVRYFGFPAGIFHRAEEDSAYCGMLFAKILETLECRGEEISEEALLRRINKPILRFPRFSKTLDQLDLF